MDINNVFNGSIKMLSEAMGDMDRAARFKNTDGDWDLDNMVYAFDYELKDGTKASVYVAKDEDDIFEYIYIVGEGFKVVYRITNEGATIRKMSSTGSIGEDSIQNGIVSDIRSMAMSALSRSKQKLGLGSSSGESSADSRSGAMPYRIMAKDVVYEAVQFKPGSVSNTVMEVDDTAKKTPVEVALESFKAALLISAISGKPLTESSYGYGTVEKVEMQADGVFKLTMSVEMPYSEDGEPKKIELTVEVTPKSSDLVKLADDIFTFTTKNTDTKEEAITEGELPEKGKEYFSVSIPDGVAEAVAKAKEKYPDAVAAIMIDKGNKDGVWRIISSSAKVEIHDDGTTDSVSDDKIYDVGDQLVSEPGENK